MWAVGFDERGPVNHRSTTDAIMSALGYDLPIHVAHAFHFARLAAELDHVELEADLVSGNDGPPELHVVERHEVHDLVFDVLPLEVAHQQHAPHLRHRLDDEHPGHDGMTRKMPLKEGLVDRDVLDADDALRPFHPR